MTNVHSAVWLWNIGTVEPNWNSRNEVQIDIIILGKISIPHWDWKSDSPLCCRDRHLSGITYCWSIPTNTKTAQIISELIAVNVKLGKIKSLP